MRHRVDDLVVAAVGSRGEPVPQLRRGDLAEVDLLGRVLRCLAGRAGPCVVTQVRNAETDTAALRSLFDSFLQARKATGESAAVKFENFQKLISQQAAKILTDKGARAVDFRLETKDGKVSLKARPVK